MHDPFADRLAADAQELTRLELTTLQINLGKMCNLACHHCHVEAGPQRTEIMTWETMENILAWIDRHRSRLPLEAVDLTGGAPEMNPCFRRLVEELRSRGCPVLDRCNLAILLEPGSEDLVRFLARLEVGIVASLPCYLEQNVDRQRGKEAFRKSMEALRRLNAAGYAKPGTGLRLDLVYNPVGTGLPPDQQALEAEYQHQLRSRFGIEFNRLLTMTNVPIARFAQHLRREGTYRQYISSLAEAHRPANLAHVMCRSLVSVGWQGGVYDCDFNQMLRLPLEPRGIRSDAAEDEAERRSRKLWTYAPEELVGRGIHTGVHCFACTAGAGSSCGGALG